MGVYKVFNQFTNKWELRGFGFRWEYDTETEANTNKRKAWEYHNQKLNAFRFVADVLVSYR